MKKFLPASARFFIGSAFAEESLRQGFLSPEEEHRPESWSRVGFDPTTRTSSGGRLLIATEGLLKEVRHSSPPGSERYPEMLDLPGFHPDGSTGNRMRINWKTKA